MVTAGESVYSKYFNASGNLAIGISANDLDLENGISYTVKVTVTMNIGLSCDATTKFTVSWDETVDEPNADHSLYASVIPDVLTLHFMVVPSVYTPVLC